MGHTSRSRAEKLEKLSSCCCRLTRPRRAILDVMDCSKRHYTADDIYRATSKITPTIGLATIYRNLEMLVRAGLIWKFDVGNHKMVYEASACHKRGHHHHLICKKCNAIIDYSGSAADEKRFVRNRMKKLSKKYHFKIENHCIDFFGLCSRCQKSR